MDEIDLKSIKNDLIKPKLTTEQCQAALEPLTTALEQLSADNLAQTLRAHYRQDVYFKDPFSEVRGLPRLIEIWQARFKQRPDAQLRCHMTACNGDTAYIEWRLLYQKSGQPVQRNGISKLLLDEHGKVKVQMDYWDSGEHFYHRLPLLGGLLRWLAARHSAN